MIFSQTPSPSGLMPGAASLAGALTSSVLTVDGSLRDGVVPSSANGFVTATLVYDSWASAKPGHRGASASRQLAFQTDLLDIALTLIVGANRMFSVAGQLFPTSALRAASRATAGFDVELVGDQLSTGDIRKCTHSDDLGEFWLDDLRAGGYHLLVRGGPVGILVTPIDLSRLAA